MVVGARQSFRFLKQIMWFLGNDRALSKFRYWIFHNLISIIKIQKNQPIKIKFKLTSRATLKQACQFGIYYIRRTQDVKKTSRRSSRTFSKRLMYVQFMSYVQGDSVKITSAKYFNRNLHWKKIAQVFSS